jgi:AcrR family transcriptional regulator
MDQIAAVAGTSKAVFYRHFADKADLYRAVGQEMARVFSDQLATRIATQRSPRDRVAAGIDTYLALLEKRPELYRFVVGNPVLERAGSDRRIDYTGIIAARIDDIIGATSATVDNGAPSLSHAPWGNAIVGFIKAAGDWWLDHPGQVSRAELTDSLTELLWHGIAGIS